MIQREIEVEVVDVGVVVVVEILNLSKCTSFRCCPRSECNEAQHIVHMQVEIALNGKTIGRRCVRDIIRELPGIHNAGRCNSLTDTFDFSNDLSGSRSNQP